jgi:hypothetical protein
VSTPILASPGQDPARSVWKAQDSKRSAVARFSSYLHRIWWWYDVGVKKILQMPLAGAVLWRLRRECQNSTAKDCFSMFVTFPTFIFCGARSTGWNFNIRSGKALVTLCVSGRSRCGALLIFDMSALCDCRIAVVRDLWAPCKGPLCRFPYFPFKDLSAEILWVSFKGPSTQVPWVPLQDSDFLPRILARRCC